MNEQNIKFGVITFCITLAVMFIGFLHLVDVYDDGVFVIESAAASEVPIIKIGVSPEPLMASVTAEPTPTATPTATPITTPMTTNLGIFRITAYCSCSNCCGKCDGITATGTKVTEGRTIAVDPNVIPYGTEVIINGHTYIAEDCGGAVNGNSIDIYMDSHQEALEFGVQYLEVFANFVSK